MRRRMPLPFADRRHAGQALAARLAGFRGRGDLLVLALPRGGVPVGLEVARALDSPLDLCVVRKLGVPGHEELAMGAVASGGVRVLNPEIVEAIALPAESLESATRRAIAEVDRRERLYRGGRPPPAVEGRVVLLVDDGLATGSTMRAAAAAVRRRRPAKVVVAVPVAARETCEALSREVDEVVCLEMPEPFFAVGLWYERFPQVDDDELRRLLDLAPFASAEGRPMP